MSPLSKAQRSAQDTSLSAAFPLLLRISPQRSHRPRLPSSQTSQLTGLLFSLLFQRFSKRTIRERAPERQAAIKVASHPTAERYSVSGPAAEWGPWTNQCRTTPGRAGQRGKGGAVRGRGDRASGLEGTVLYAL